jgi:hypothetical protein
MQRHHVEAVSCDFGDEAGTTGQMGRQVTLPEVQELTTNGRISANETRDRNRQILSACHAACQFGQFFSTREPRMTPIRADQCGRTKPTHPRVSAFQALHIGAAREDFTDVSQCSNGFLCSSDSFIRADSCHSWLLF